MICAYIAVVRVTGTEDMEHGSAAPFFPISLFIWNSWLLGKTSRKSRLIHTLPRGQKVLIPAHGRHREYVYGRSW